MILGRARLQSCHYDPIPVVILRQRSLRQSRRLPTKDLCTTFFPTQTKPRGAPSLRSVQRWEATLPKRRSARGGNSAVPHGKITLSSRPKRSAVEGPCVLQDARGSTCHQPDDLGKGTTSVVPQRSHPRGHPEAAESPAKPETPKRRISAPRSFPPKPNRGVDEWPSLSRFLRRLGRFWIRRSEDEQLRCPYNAQSPSR
jgi:hypothetical protein